MFHDRQSPRASRAEVREEATNGSGKATPQGVFDWMRSGQSGVWGNPNKRAAKSKRISPLIACRCYQKFVLLKIYQESAEITGQRQKRF